MLKGSSRHALGNRLHRQFRILALAAGPKLPGASFRVVRKIGRERSPSRSQLRLLVRKVPRQFHIVFLLVALVPMMKRVREQFPEIKAVAPVAVAVVPFFFFFPGRMRILRNVNLVAIEMIKEMRNVAVAVTVTVAMASPVLVSTPAFGVRIMRRDLRLKLVQPVEQAVGRSVEVQRVQEMLPHSVPESVMAVFLQLIVLAMGDRLLPVVVVSARNILCVMCSLVQCLQKGVKLEGVEESATSVPADRCNLGRERPVRDFVLHLCLNLEACGTADSHGSMMGVAAMSVAAMAYCCETGAG